ncbi:N-acetylneuraminate synthase [Paenibacillus sp. OK076]|uniref:N-acetylneuraminate synthase n=1 Tax=Paenibacillus sp. OK076 TaxID=1884379 RepID=UPI0008CD998C|nr:N-acetylneuraminate synthase [Paenibacillus sp. OK076]SEO66721.1 N-acetylneuraminate synthase [Paenibacillus sp. OK076]
MSKFQSRISGGAVYIIAEVGVNHNGSLNRALQCVDQALLCGADAVKFQTFNSKKLVTRHAQKAEYQTENTGDPGGQLEMLQQLELSYSDFIEIKRYCDKREIDFLSTPFDEESADFLNSIQVDALKISSGDMNNIPFLQKVDQYERPIILSTGMANLNEIRESLEVIAKSDVSLLHCTSDYPAPIEDVNLLAIRTMAAEFKKVIGYSDHTKGIEVSIAAVAIGAQIIEKHFTLDRSLPGPDHQASLEPDEFAALVKAIRKIEQSMGDGVKRCMPSEESTKSVARKSLVAGRAMQAGEQIQEQDVVIKRPGTGIPPKYYFDVVGKILSRDVEEDQLLSREDFE